MIDWIKNTHNKVMNGKRTPFILSAIIFLSSLAVLSFYKTLETHLYVQQSESEFSQTLRKSSDDLTNFARLYVTTRDEKWREAFENVLEVRNGTLPDENGELIPLNVKIRRNGFTDEELQIFDTAERLSNNLAEMEQAAFKIVTMNSKTSTLAGAKARRIMFGDDYQKYKDEIMTEIGRFETTVRDRLMAEHMFLMNMAWVLIIVINVCLLMLAIVISHQQGIVVSGVKKKPVRKRTTRKTPVKRKPKVSIKDIKR